MAKVILKGAARPPARRRPRMRRLRMTLVLPPGTPVSLVTDASGRITLTLDLAILANETPLDFALVKTVR